MRATLLVILLAGDLAIFPGVRAEETAAHFILSSPDGNLTLRVETSPALALRLVRGLETLLEVDRMALTLAGEPDRVLDGRHGPLRESRREHRAVLHPVVPEKRSVIPDEYNELDLRFGDGYGLVVRVYDDGAAWRFVTDQPGEITVRAETAAYRFPGDPVAWFGEEENFMTHSERVYPKLAVKSLATRQMACLPVLVRLDSGTLLAVTEADLADYPGMYLRGDGREALLHARFPSYPLKEELRRDRDLVVTERADYLAVTAGKRAYPWRAVLVATQDRQLLENDLVYRLAPDLELSDTAWIRPGKVAWDWWNANNLFGVNFEAGINTATYCHYIDFAARYGIGYIILDEGWSDTTDLFKINPKLDLPAVLRHARSQNVGIILWCVWLTLERQMDEALPAFEEWGVKGIKVDFMQRDDQKMVNFYWKCARQAAAHHLLVDFHGAYKPTGLRRAYPNVLTREGVRGLEWNKWSRDVTPAHDVTLPFTRMLAGPMDYTPGAMLNAQEKEFAPVFRVPMSQGTRCHQLAIYVIFESPLQMLADSPSHYWREPEAMELLAAVPTTWHETRALDARVGEYVLLARRTGEEWWVAAMTDGSARTLDVSFDFLGQGPWRADIWQDGVNAHRHGRDFVRRPQQVDAATTLTVRLAPGGGWVARIRR
ncbi:MAG: glycoside hydrolase family 97 protein [Acidobacteria bacterium]|nr:glycoside hydrolase family 97 protein [Acidobacteriota bacterium]